METPLIAINIAKRLHSADGEMTLAVEAGLEGGELVALFGPSGSGKTTLLRILAGLTIADSGSVRCGDDLWFDGDKKINLSPRRRHVGFMFQDYALFPNMTVKENIQFAGPGKDFTHAMQLMEVFGLMELSAIKPGKLSGGQQQRVALARALACRPQLLLLDEPLSALDLRLRTALQEEIAKAHRMLGATTIMVSHDINEVVRLADRVLCIERGKLTAMGKPDEVFPDREKGIHSLEA